MSTYKDPNEILEFIFEKWNSSGLEINKRQQSRVRKTMQAKNALSDKILDLVNEATTQYQPQDDLSDWLVEIDNFFCEPADKIFFKQNNLRVDKTVKKNVQYRNEFVDVITLLTPLVYFDHLVSMESFDDKFLYSMELAFVTRIHIPRNLNEAQRLYKMILELPKSFDYHKLGKPYKSPQPYMAQMMFAVLMMRETEKNSELWSYQYNCLKNCPDYLLDYPDISKEGFTYRPAFWMAYDVSDPDFRKILLERGSGELKRKLDNVMDHESKHAKAVSELTSESEPATRPLQERVSEEQSELVNLLIEFEELLKKDYEDVYKGLYPGVNDDQITKLNEALHPLKISEDLATLYKWHNGTKYDGFLFGFPDFRAIEDALQEYRNALEFGEEFSWCKAWFTFSYESRVYILVPLSEETKIESPVLHHDIEGGEVEIYHESIKAMIKTYIEAYREGVIAFDETESYREINTDKFDEIRLKYSPKAYCYPKQTSACYDPYKISNWPEEWKKYHIGEEM